MKNFKKYFEILKTSGLFSGIDAAGLEATLNCLGAQTKDLSKDEIILSAGDKPEHVGIVLLGQLYITREDYAGNRAIITAISPGGIFAEALCCAGVDESPVSVAAGCSSLVMLLGFSRILHACPNTCEFHAKLIENMLRLLAEKNMFLQGRMEIISMKTIRSKVMRYLENLMPELSAEFTIPFNREEMADYLCVERSALSHELARMKKDGLIEYRKNKFIVKRSYS